jgi:hypothetical protein
VGCPNLSWLAKLTSQRQRKEVEVGGGNGDQLARFKSDYIGVYLNQGYFFYSLKLQPRAHT